MGGRDCNLSGNNLGLYRFNQESNIEKNPAKKADSGVPSHTGISLTKTRPIEVVRSSDTELRNTI